MQKRFQIKWSLRINPYGKTYTVRVKKEGQKVTCYLDGEQILETNLKNYASQLVYTSANIDDDANMLYVKLVNPQSTAAETTLSFTNGRAVSGLAEVLSSPNGTDENTLGNPYYITPKNQNLSVESDGKIIFNCAPYSVNVLRLNVADVEAPVVEPLPEARLSYTFSEGNAKDDSGNYTGTLRGKASIVQMEDGNYVLATGQQGEQSYMDIPVAAVRNALTDATDFTISLDLLPRAANNTNNYCWAFEFANGTSQYIGLICAGGNGNWYYQAKGNSTTSTVDSWAGLRLSEWHNLTYTQKDGVGRMYVDGQLRNTKNVNANPSEFLSKITSASIGHSPFSADAIMENTLFDNLLIFDRALSETQVRDIASRAVAMPIDHAFDNLEDLQDLETLVKEVKNYYKDTDDTDLSNAYSAASRALSSTSLSVKRQRYQKLVEAVNNYQQQELDKAQRGQPANLTFLITNSSFTRYNIGWQGIYIPTSGNYAGYANETAEQFSRPFDLWQEISDLPEGTYTLTCNAFYRAGDNTTGYAAWQASDPTTQYAQLYLGEASTPLVNLYSSEQYTYEPYNYPDNLTAASKAFNTDGQYGENSVTYTLEASQPLRLGIRKPLTVAADWVAYDHFQLHYEGTATGISGVQSENYDVQGVIYDLSGRRVKNPSRGIYIRDGRKVLIR